MVLTISASDSSGLAGSQMDARCLQGLGVHAAQAMTAVTAQNSGEFSALNAISASQLESQIDAALALKPQLIKVGMLASGEQVAMLAKKLPALKLPVVYNPVLQTSSGRVVVDECLLAQIKKTLLPGCDLITPNLPEAELLSGLSADTGQAKNSVADALQSMGAKAVVICGGHSAGPFAEDFCYTPAANFSLRSPKLATSHLRGTGCAFASFIAGALALGYELRDALVIAKMAMQEGLAAGLPINGEQGHLQPLGFPTKAWPQLIDGVINPPANSGPFAACVGGGEAASLGLYPIVDRASWLERLLPLGVTTVQLRIKDLTGQSLADEIHRAVALSQRYGARLFINDYWQLAIAAGAYGVHLGQEDLHSADLAAIQRADLRLGLSSHSHFEVARALTLQPSYLACGPTFATTTKKMPWQVHGLAGLAYWLQALPSTPLVAIAGIDEHNIAEVAATGVSAIAVITAITRAADPEQKTQRLLELINQARRADA